MRADGRHLLAFHGWIGIDMSISIILSIPNNTLLTTPTKVSERPEPPQDANQHRLFIYGFKRERLALKLGLLTAERDPRAHEIRNSTEKTEMQVSFFEEHYQTL